MINDSSTKLYMEVTTDEFELPVVIADSRLELSKASRVDKSTVTKCLNRHSEKSKYIEIDLDDEDDSQEECNELRFEK